MCIYLCLREIAFPMTRCIGSVRTAPAQPRLGMQCPWAYLAPGGCIIIGYMGIYTTIMGYIGAYGVL